MWEETGEFPARAWDQMSGQEEKAGRHHGLLSGLQEAGGVPRAGPRIHTQETEGWWLAPSWDFIQGPGAGGLVRPDGPKLMFMEQRALQRYRGPSASLLPGCPGMSRL